MIEVCNPATCEILGTVPDCDAAEVNRAVAVARASFENKTWRGPKNCCLKRWNAIQTARWRTTQWRWCAAAKGA